MRENISEKRVTLAKKYPVRYRKDRLPQIRTKPYETWSLRALSVTEFRYMTLILATLSRIIRSCFITPIAFLNGGGGVLPNRYLPLSP
jgi:hypothetical protein